MLYLSDLAPTQIHNRAHHPAGIYWENWVQAQVAQVVFYATAENRLQFPLFKCCILHKIIIFFTFFFCFQPMCRVRSEAPNLGPRLW
jgi:hypothetical protein